MTDVLILSVLAALIVVACTVALVWFRAHGGRWRR